MPVPWLSSRMFARETTAPELSRTVPKTSAASNCANRGVTARSNARHGFIPIAYPRHRKSQLQICEHSDTVRMSFCCKDREGRLVVDEEAIGVQHGCNRRIRAEFTGARTPRSAGDAPGKYAAGI